MLRVAAAMAVLAWSFAASVARAAPTLEDYGKLRAMEHVTLSPSGAAYAYVINQDGKSAVFVASTDGRPPLAIDAGGATIANLIWAGDEHLLIETATLGQLGPGFTSDKALMHQISVFNLHTHSGLKVFDHKPGIGSIIEGYYGARLIAGHWFGYFAGFNEARPVREGVVATKRDLFRVDLDSGETKLLSTGSDQAESWLISATGDVVTRSQGIWSSGAWTVLAGPSGAETLASGQSALKAGYVKLGRTQDELLLSRPAETDSDVTLQTMPVSGGQHRCPGPGRHRLSDVRSHQRVVDRNRQLRRQAPGAVLLGHRPGQCAGGLRRLPEPDGGAQQLESGLHQVHRFRHRR
jgi:hypothetical protein